MAVVNPDVCCSIMAPIAYDQSPKFEASAHAFVFPPNCEVPVLYIWPDFAK